MIIPIFLAGIKARFWVTHGKIHPAPFRYANVYMCNYSVLYSIIANQ
jgi:hypothetical protein